MIDHIYFLTLNNAFSRENNTKKQIEFLHNHGYTNYEIFKNYKWPKFITTFLKKNFFPNLGHGIYSCITGHYAIMHDALDKGYEYVLICEDDAVFTENTINFLKKIEIEYNDLDFDCIKMHYILENFGEQQLIEYKFDFINDDLFRVNKLPENYYIWSNLCFLVNRKFMKAYIEYFDSIFSVADKPTIDYDNFINKYGIKVYYTNKQQAHEMGIDTFIL